MILKVVLKAVVSEIFNQHNQPWRSQRSYITMLLALTSIHRTFKADGFIWGVWTYLHLCLGKHLSELWQQTVNSTRKRGFRILARFSCSLESLFKYLRDLLWDVSSKVLSLSLPYSLLQQTFSDQSIFFFFNNFHSDYRDSKAHIYESRHSSGPVCVVLFFLFSKRHKKYVFCATPK